MRAISNMSGGPGRAALAAGASGPAPAPDEALVAGELGALLRTFRERLSPQTAGIRPTAPAARRVPGLRRDELARLASVSEEHLRRLEQGRRRPSRAMVDALAGALRLDRPDHARLRLLAGFAAPRSRPARRRVAPQAVIFAHPAWPSRRDIR